MITNNINSRWTAFFFHLAISLLLFLVCAAVIKFTWYPGVLFSTEGGINGIKLIAGVDIIIGPVLTLFVYQRTKKELNRDLLIIAGLQLLCLSGGMYIVEQNRPIAIIYTNSIFSTSTRTQYESYNINIENSPLLTKSWPAWIYLELPQTPAAKRKATIDIYAKGDIRVATHLYRPYIDNIDKIRQEGWSLNRAKVEGYDVHLDDIEKQKFIRIYNLVTRYGLYKISVDTSNGKIINLVTKNNDIE